jgi:hypothetical protein
MEQLIREGNYIRRNNAKAAATGMSVILPARRTQEFRMPNRVTFCQYCLAAVDRNNFSRHQAGCSLALSMEEECKKVKGNLQQLEQ